MTKQAEMSEGGASVPREGEGREESAHRELDSMVGRLNGIRHSLIRAGFVRTLAPEEQDAIEALNAFMSFVTAAPMPGLLAMAHRVVGVRREAEEIKALLDSVCPRTETVATRGKPAASDGDSRPEALAKSDPFSGSR